MCYTKSSAAEKATKAKSDIYVFKYLKKVNGQLRSPFQIATWKVGREKRVRNMELETCTLSIHEGLHAHRVLQNAINVAIRGKGIVCLAKIPKGAMYYENDTEVCANRMIILRQFRDHKKKK